MTKKLLIRLILYRLTKLGNPLQRKKIGNLLLNTFEFIFQKKQLRSMPLGIDIVSTKRCNINCIMCRKYISGEPWDMPLETFEKIAQIFFPYILYIRFGSAGEHFLNKNFESMLKICRDYKVDVFITSNGTLINKAWAQKLIDYEVKKVGISFDGATRKTYESIRRGSNYIQVLQNIKTLVRLRNDQNKKHPDVFNTYAIMKRNVEELPIFVKMAKKIGIDHIRVQYLFTHYFMSKDESLYLYPELTKKIFQKSKQKAKKLGVDLWLPSLSNKTRRNTKLATCHYPWSEFSIDPEGNIAFCCDAWGLKPMGNIFKEEFFTVWNNKKFQNLRKTVNSKNPCYALCKNCRALQRNPDNLNQFFDDYHIKNIKQAQR